MNANKVLALVLFTFLVTTVTAQKRRPEREPPVLTTAQVKAFAASLEGAHKAGKEEGQIKLLTQAIWINDARVSKAVGRYLDAPSTNIRKAALHALRYHENRAALKLLIDAAGQKNILKDEACAVEAYLALGQHGEKSAVPALIENLWANPRKKVIAARCNALAHIRHKTSIDALIKMLRMGRQSRRGGGGKAKGAARGVYRALTLLTGEDLKPQAHLWKRWWSANRARFEISDQPTGLNDKESRQWQKMWRKPRFGVIKRDRADREEEGDRKRKGRRKRRRDGERGDG